jgi:hypothetical protein
VLVGKKTKSKKKGGNKTTTELSKSRRSYRKIKMNN